MPREFPFYQQLDAMDCGATCLRMIARYYGRYYSLEYLRDLTFIGKQGVSLLGISDAAENLGLQSLAVEITFDRIREDIPMPCIAYWQQEHFVVVYKASSRHIWIADPKAGKFKLSKEEFLNNWAVDEEEQGILLLLETTPEFYSRDGEEINKGGFSYLLNYLGKYRALLMQLMMGLLLGSVLQVIFPFLVKSMIDVGVYKVDLSFVSLVVVAQLILFVTSLAIESLRRRMILHIGVRVNISLISDFLMKLMRLPVRFFDAKLTGDLMQRIADHERIQRFLTSTSLMSIFSMVNFVAFLFVLAYWDIRVFSIYLAGTMLQLTWLVLVQRRKRVLDYKRFDQAVEHQTQLMELINGMQEIKLHNAERQKRWNWEHTQASMYWTSLRSLTIEESQQTGGRFINETKNLLITFVVVTAVVQNNMTVGMLVAIHYILAQLNGPLNQIVSFVSALQEAKISLERMNEIHAKEEEDVVGEKITVLPELRDLTLENVSFQYNGPQSPLVLSNVSLEIPKGKTTAIVGTSGSGKTTLLKLLLNIYQPSEGVVKVGDSNLDHVSKRLWRGKCGAVMQDGYIFNDSIAKNIALGDEIIDKQRLLKAVKVANIQSFIESLPLGYSTKIGQNGVGLSQGQKQRLLIARAIYKDPSYLFFDEATSALDAYNEMIVMEELEEFFVDRTVVIIAHRLSTVKNADNIIVLDRGEVVEQGTHEELTYLRGAYYYLVRNQLELGN